MAGARSALPWIFFATSDPPAVICTNCGVAEAVPPPPKDPNSRALFSPTSKEYALYVLTEKLYPFYVAHESCAKKEMMS